MSMKVIPIGVGMNVAYKEVKRPLTVVGAIPFLCPTATTEIMNVSPGCTVYDLPDLLQLNWLFSYGHIQNGLKEILEFILSFSM